MATSGWWIARLVDPSKFGDKYDVNMVIETAFGTKEARPHCPLDDQGLIERTFVAGSFSDPPCQARLHCLVEADLAPQYTRAVFDTKLQESVKGKAVLDAAAARKAVIDAEGK